MANDTFYDVIIVGGSYSGLSAGMALGRALRKVLIIDSGLPCNRQTPHSHNFLTHDGATPQAIAAIGKEQVLAYDTVTFKNGLVVSATQTADGFTVETAAGDTLAAKKLLFATGLRDVMPEIPGFSECWGISVLHCPYCHGYEVRNLPTGIFASGPIAFEFSQLIANWTKDLTLFTNGPSGLTQEQAEKLRGNGIAIVETEIGSLRHTNGKIEALLLKDGSDVQLTALYAKIPFEQHCSVPQQLGCQLTEMGLIQADSFGKTTVPGVYVSGDSANMRSVAVAVASGTMAGAFLNHELVGEAFA